VNETHTYSDEHFLRLALDQAKAAAEAGEVPIGAVLVHNGEVIATGQNRVIRQSDPTAHAEIVALREAGRILDNYRLTGCELYVTLEPCAMCAGAMMHARLSRLVYGASDSKAGADGSVLQVLNHSRSNHQISVERGLLAEDCGSLLREFFAARR
jgi:tRNA(adenine34) deaminase